METELPPVNEATHGTHGFPHTPLQFCQQLTQCDNLYIKQETPYGVQCAETLALHIKQESGNEQDPVLVHVLKKKLNTKLNRNDRHQLIIQNTFISDTIQIKVEGNNSNNDMKSECSRPGSSAWSPEVKRELETCGLAQCKEELTQELGEDFPIDIGFHFSHKSAQQLDRHTDCKVNVGNRPVFLQEEIQKDSHWDGYEESDQNLTQFARSYKNAGNSHKCEHCNYVARYKGNLLKHINNKHDPGAKVYECVECAYATKQKGDLLRHVRVKHDANARVYECTDCDYATKSKNNLLVHLSVRHATNTEFHKCPVCAYTTRNKSTLSRHVRVKHNADAPVHKCVKCTYGTKQKGELGRHVKLMHSAVVALHKCAECDYATKWKNNLVKHFRLRHDADAEMHACVECDYSTKQKVNLAHHIAMNHDANADVHKCAHCGYSTKWRNNLLKHFREKHDANIEPHRCAECDYTTKRMANLLKHVQAKHKL